jgi:hypothetical protein
MTAGVIITRPTSAPAVSGSFAASGESFLVLTSSAELTNERVLVAGVGIKFIDSGPGGTFTAVLNMRFNEMPSGSVDGANTFFGLDDPPTPTDSLMLHRNGMLMAQGVGSDYILSGSTVTFSKPPRSGSNLFATYVKP